MADDPWELFIALYVCHKSPFLPAMQVEGFEYEAEADADAAASDARELADAMDDVVALHGEQLAAAGEGDAADVLDALANAPVRSGRVIEAGVGRDMQVGAAMVGRRAAAAPAFTGPPYLRCSRCARPGELKEPHGVVH